MDIGNQFQGYSNDVIGLIVDIELLLLSAIAEFDVAKWLFSAVTCQSRYLPWTCLGAICLLEIGKVASSRGREISFTSH